MLSVFRALGGRVMQGGAFLRVGLSACLLVAVTGCKLVDQRTFDANAGKAPQPYIPPPPPAPPGPPPVPPLVTLVAGTPQAQWQGPVDRVVHLALARKPGVLFVVKCLVPQGTDMDAEQAALVRLVQGDGRAVMQAIINAGASETQVEMSAMPDSTVTAPVVRVYVR